MPRPSIVLAVSLVAVGILVPVSAGEDAPPSTAAESLVGQEMPFHVAGFVNGERKGRSGCPSVMISNSRGRGLIVWDRGAGEQAFALAKALDDAAVEGQKFQRYLVAFGKNDALDTRAAELAHVVAGHARSAVSTVFDGRGVDADAKLLVFLLDRKVIKAAYGLKDDEATDERIKEIVAAATKFAAGDE